MRQIFNSLFSFLKLLLFFSALSLTLFIIVQMYQRLGKNILSSIKVFIPYLLIFALFIINIFARQNSVTKNIFYNITCCLVFATVVVVALRAILDNNMVLKAQLGRNINFNFFDYIIRFMKTILYVLCLSNVFLMFNGRSKPKKEIAEQID